MRLVVLVLAALSLGACDVPPDDVSTSDAGIAQPQVISGGGGIIGIGGVIPNVNWCVSEARQCHNWCRASYGSWCPACQGACDIQCEREFQLCTLSP